MINLTLKNVMYVAPRMVIEDSYGYNITISGKCIHPNIFG